MKRNRENQILHTLSNVYFSVHEVDLTTDYVRHFQTSPIISNVVPDGPGAIEKMNKAMTQFVVETQRKEVLEFNDLSTISFRLKGRQTLSAEFVGIHIGWFRAKFVVLETDKYGFPTVVLHTVETIDKQKRYEEDLIRGSYIDELTGLLNRKAYEEELNKISEKKLNIDSVYVACDINGLKTVNDTLGHPAGDELIKGAAECLKKVLGSYGSIYRVGGDEFVALIFSSENQIENLKQDIDSTISQWKGKLVESLSMSCGFASVSEFKNLDSHDIVKIADKRMYEEKENYYKNKGIDRRNQKKAYEVICQTFTKILKINLTDDSFEIIKADEKELTDSRGYANKISDWLKSFAEKGMVHPEDKELYLEKTNLSYIKKYLKKNDVLTVYYRRKIGRTYKDAMMEIVSSPNSQTEVFLYVKNISK